MTRCALAAAEAGPKRALVLAGGGMRVAWQAGALLAMEAAGLRFHHFDAASGGTFNLGMLLSGLGPREMAERWRSLDVKAFVSLLPVEDYLRSDWPAFGSAEGLTSKVFPHLGIDPAAIRACEGLTATFNLCNATRKTLEALPHTGVEMEALVAAVSLPGFMPGVEWRGSTYLDAVWIKDANLWEAVKRGAEEIWLLWCIGNAPVYHGGAFRQYVHMIEMSANGALFEELDRIRDLNARIGKGDSPYGQRSPVRLHVVKPDQALPLDPDFYLGRIDAGSLMALGFAAASSYLRGMDPEGLPLTPEITTMSEARPGLSFRETMSGPFSLGVQDPQAGKEKAEFTAALHASVHIPDMARFTEDPTHTGVLSGTVDLGPLGTAIPCPTGVFRLFSPTEEPNTRHMVYEVGFELDGRPHWLSGHKIVRDDAGFDLWRDTTTLYTTLHEGRDATGPILGAGVLSLGVADLAALVRTLSVTDAEGVDRPKTLAAFGRFFLGKLWETYGVHA